MQIILDEAMWLTFIQAAIKILVILIVSTIVVKAGKSLIRKFFLVRSKTSGLIKISERRDTTLMKLLENVLSYVVYFIVSITILELVGIEVKALLAGAGILGLAVGFGAQNLVKDVITGFFIILEDQFSVGDYVKINTFEGEVIEIGLRTTKIKGSKGELHVIPNGNITQVTNSSIYNSIAVIDIGISKEEDLNKATSAIEELLLKLPEKYGDLVKPPELLGLQKFTQTEIVLRVVAETVPMRQGSINRVLKNEIKGCLDSLNIDNPVSYDEG